MSDTQTSVATLQPAGLPVDISQLEADSHLGGKVTLKDMSVPFLYILQTNSPQVNPDSPKYIKDARAGMFYLTVIEKVFEGREEGIYIIPCYYERKLPEWRPREKGGGIIATHPADGDILMQSKPNEKGVPTLQNGNLLIDTAYHYVLVNDKNTNQWHQAIFPMKSTALKISRKFNSLVTSLTIPGRDVSAPRFLYKWNLRSIKEEKDGNVWSSPMIAMSNMVDQTQYANAKAYCEVAMKGIINTATESVGEESISSVSRTDTERNKPRIEGDQIPF